MALLGVNAANRRASGYWNDIRRQRDAGGCARMAVARGDAVYNSPIFETEVKGGAYSITLHLYRRALAGVIARGLSLHK